jgi:hypothetical protein
MSVPGLRSRAGDRVKDRRVHFQTSLVGRSRRSGDFVRLAATASETDLAAEPHSATKHPLV